MKDQYSKALYRPRRSMLFVPGWQDKYLEKSAILDVDSVIFDWEESVPSQEKDNSRKRTLEKLKVKDYGWRERVIRINRRESPWFAGDIQALSDVDAHPYIDSIIVPDIRSAKQAKDILKKINSAIPDIPVHISIESARAALQAETIVAVSDQIISLVMESNSLSTSLKLYPNSDREGLLFTLARLVLVARAYHKNIIDGAYLNYKQPETFELHCRQARNLGCDGKTLIHPNQAIYANEAFRPRESDIVRAKEIIAAVEYSTRHGQALGVVDGSVIEPIDVANAQRILALGKTLEH